MTVAVEELEGGASRRDLEATEAIDTQADGDAATPAFASGGGNGIFASPTDIACCC